MQLSAKKLGLTSLLLCAVLSQPTLRAANPLATHAEQTGFRETGRYAEVETLSKQFERQFPGQVRRVIFGQTPEGRPLIALIASADGVLTPALAQKKNRPVIFFQGGIHAGEIDGKDAGFRVLQSLLADPARQSILKNLTVVFVPVFNVDGHERFGPNNRPNQIGPAEMGWRVNAQNLNLNRDYAKVDSPEMRSMHEFYNAWDPLVSLDLHVTDGSEFQHEVAVMIQPRLSGPPALRKISESIQTSMLASLEEEGHLPLAIYPTFEREDDPTSGIAVGVSPPRFSQGYWGLRNRIGILVETHSWKDYATRVRATEDVLWSALTQTSAQGSKWLDQAHAADQEMIASVPGSPVDLAFKNTDESHLFEFQGYAYTKTHSEITGQDWIQYDRTKKQVWKIPVFDKVKPTLTVRAPLGGYLIPPGYAAPLISRLKAHGIEFRTLRKATPGSLVQVFRAEQMDFAKESFEGRQQLSVTGNWSTETQDLPPGTIFIPIHQRLAVLVMQLMEPLAPDSFLSWGFFNSAFERKEYMEAYVTEVVAREQLKNPEIAALFKKKKEDKEFASNPKKCLEFFQRLHPSWDNHYGLAPVFRTDQTF